MKSIGLVVAALSLVGIVHADILHYTIVTGDLAVEVDNNGGVATDISSPALQRLQARGTIDVSVESRSATERLVYLVQRNNCSVSGERLQLSVPCGARVYIFITGNGSVLVKNAHLNLMYVNLNQGGFFRCINSVVDVCGIDGTGRGKIECEGLSTKRGVLDVRGDFEVRDSGSLSASIITKYFADGVVYQSRSGRTEQFGVFPPYQVVQPLTLHELAQSALLFKSATRFRLLSQWYDELQDGHPQGAPFCEQHADVMMAHRQALETVRHEQEEWLAAYKRTQKDEQKTLKQQLEQQLKESMRKHNASQKDWAVEMAVKLDKRREQITNELLADLEKKGEAIKKEDFIEKGSALEKAYKITMLTVLPLLGVYAAVQLGRVFRNYYRQP